MVKAGLQSQTPFVGLSIAAPARAAGVVVRPITDRAAFQVRPQRESLARLRAEVRRAFALELPVRACVTAANCISFAWIGCEAWIASADRGAVPDLGTRLQSALGDCATLVEQSDGRATWRVEGAAILAVLAKLTPIDLHPRTFHSGDTCMTRLANLNAQITKINGAPVFEIVLARAFVASFWHALLEAAAEFGITIAGEQQ